MSITAAGAMAIGAGLSAGSKLLGEFNKYGLQGQAHKNALEEMAQKHGYTMEEMQQQYALAYQNAVGLANLNNSAQLNLANVNNRADLVKQIQQQAFDSMKYQIAVDDMKKAGLNVGALGSSMDSPSVVGSNGSVKPVGYNSQLDPQNQDINSALQLLAHRNKRAFGKAFSDSQKATKKSVMQSL